MKEGCGQKRRLHRRRSWDRGRRRSLSSLNNQVRAPISGLVVHSSLQSQQSLQLEQLLQSQQTEQPSGKDKNLVQIAREVNDLATRARNDRLKPDDIQDGTFSITNAGVFGAINSAPVINVPEVAILGVHKIVERPVYQGGQIVVRPMMNAAIGFDHRVIDGELAVKFLRRVCELLERPELLWFYA